MLAHLCSVLQVLALTQGQRFPLQTAEALMDTLEQQQQAIHETPPPAAAAADVAAAATANAAAAADAGPSVDAAAAEEEQQVEDDMEPPPDELLQMLTFTSGLHDGSSSSSTNTSGGSTCNAADGDAAVEGPAAEAPAAAVEGPAAEAPAAAAEAPAAAAATAAALQRSHQQVMQQLGGVLKQAANSPACGAAVWGLLGHWYGLQGQLLSSQEARLKQVRVCVCGGGGIWCLCSSTCVC
jgi:hypothetical protein